jgi:hypothetical protein
MVLIVCSADAQKPKWPTISDFTAAGKDWHVSTGAGLSQTELSEVLQIVGPSIDANCRKALGNSGEKSVLRKLSVRREPLRADEAAVLAVQGGDDWEDSSDDCFGDGHMNYDLWLVEFSHHKADVLLNTLAMSHLVLGSQTNGRADIATARRSGETQLELTWWRFDGEHYAPSLCASQQISEAAISSGSMKTIDQTSKLSEHPCRKASWP